MVCKEDFQKLMNIYQEEKMKHKIVAQPNYLEVIIRKIWIFFSLFSQLPKKHSNPKKSNYKENLMDVIDWSNLFV